jgi:hypothetical protein
MSSIYHYFKHKLIITKLFICIILLIIVKYFYIPSFIPLLSTFSPSTATSTSTYKIHKTRAARLNVIPDIPSVHLSGELPEDQLSQKFSTGKQKTKI